MNRSDFQSVALERFEDAKVLLEAGRYAGAYYLCGYAIECALKACIAKQTNRDDFPPKNAQSYYTHDLEKLLKIALLEEEVKRESEPKSPEEGVEEDSKPKLSFGKSWTIVKDWTEEARYQSIDPKQARAMLEAVGDSKHGVLQWLQQRW